MHLKVVLGGRLNACCFSQFPVGNSLQPGQCHGRQEGQALDKQDRGKQVSLEEPVKVGRVDRDAAGDQQRAEHGFRRRREGCLNYGPVALAGTMEVVMPRRKCGSKRCTRDRPLDGHGHHHRTKHLPVRNRDP